MVERAHLRGPLLRAGARLGRRHRHASRRRLLLRARGEPRLGRPGGTSEPRGDRLCAPLLRRPRRAPTLRPPVLLVLRRGGSRYRRRVRNAARRAPALRLITGWTALVIAALIAAIGTATALAWSSGSSRPGLIGATLARPRSGCRASSARRNGLCRTRFRRHRNRVGGQTLADASPSAWPSLRRGRSIARSTDGMERRCGERRPVVARPGGHDRAQLDSSRRTSRPCPHR